MFGFSTLKKVKKMKKPLWRACLDLSKEMNQRFNTDIYSTPGNRTVNSSIKNRAVRWHRKTITVVEEMEEKRDKRKRGKTRRRVNIRKKDFATKKDCIGVDKDLTTQLIKIKDCLIKEGQKKMLCKYLDIEAQVINSGLFCPICGQEILIGDFFRERADLQKIEMAHMEALSEEKINHRAGNVKWAHRSCNQFQGTCDIDDQWLLEKARRIFATLSERHEKKMQANNEMSFSHEPI